MEDANRAREEALRPEPRLSRMVLIVDDDEITRDLLGVLLQREGYRVAVAADGLEALDLLAEGPKPDLIFLDMMMPRLDGWRFLEVKARAPALKRVPVLISTAFGEASRSWANALGAVGFLPKPIDVTSLLVEVAGALRLSLS